MQPRTTNSQAKQDLPIFLLKSVIALVVVVVGVSLGIIYGSAFSLAGQLKPEDLTNSTFLEIGDHFPNYKLQQASDGTVHTVEELVSLGPTLFIFASPTCGACQTMLKIWDRRVTPNLRPDIQIVLVFDKSEVTEDNVTTLTAQPFGARLYMTDRHAQTEEDGIIATPTTIAVDSSNRIKFVATGFVKNVDSDFINRSL